MRTLPPLLALISLISGCFPAYRPSPVASDNLRTLGCLDLSFTVGGDGRIPDGSLLLDVQIGNRCSYPAALDLTALAIDARDAEGRVTSMRIYDPRGEIKPFTVDASISALERIRIDPSPSNGGELVTVCLDLSRVAPDTPNASPTQLCIPRRWSTP